VKYVILLCIILIIVFVEIKRELQCFKVTRYQLTVPGLKREMKAVFLSDMHNHCYGESNIELYEAVNEEHPDIILIGGDMLVGKASEDYKTAYEFVKELPSICPVYYANGNHEQRMKEIPENYMASYEEYKNGLVQSGIRFLENESEIIE